MGSWRWWRLTDVEVTSRVTELVFSLADGNAILGENGTSQGKATAVLVDRLESRGPVGVLVDVHGKDGAEDLLVEQSVVRGVGKVHGGVHVVANGLIVSTTGKQLKGGILVAGVDDRLNLLEGAAVDHGTHVSLQILVGASNGDLLDTSLQLGKELFGLGFGQVETRCSRALLALVLE